MAAISPSITQQGPIKPTAKQRANAESPVFRLASYFRDRAMDLRGKRLARNARVTEINDKIEPLEVARAATARDIERGMRAPANWSEEYDSEIKALKAEREQLHAKKFSGLSLEPIERFIHRESPDAWRPYTRKHHEGDTRAPSAIRAECREKTKAAQAAVDRIVTARVTCVDAKRRAERQLDRLAEEGKPSLYQLFAGFNFDIRGEYAANATPFVEWPKTELIADGEQIPTHNMLALVVWADLAFWKKRIGQLIDAEGDDENAVGESERPKLLAAVRAELIEHQRGEEEVIKLCEAEGQLVGRPAEWPVPIMLEIERAPAHASAPTRAPSGKAATLMDLKGAATDDFEGDDK